MNNLGFKKLTIDNWLEPDTFMKIFAQLDSNGNVDEISKEEWLQDILEIQLTDTVPEEIIKLFEVSKNTMSYGYFFYPIYTLASEQLYRVVESAVTHKCKIMKASNKDMKTFKLKIKFLMENSVLSKSEELRWEGIRGLRNSASHPETQSIILPTMALGALERTANIINSIFKDIPVSHSR